MWRLVFLSLVALSQGIKRSEFDAFNQYYRSHRRVCGEGQFFRVTEDRDTYVLATSALPAHNIYRTNQYLPQRQDWAFTIPKDPKPLDTPLCTPTGSPVGFARDGVPFYGPLTDTWTNAVEGGCSTQLDKCHGTIDSNNVYNYRELPDMNPNCMDIPERNNNNVLLGVALDGFPIYYDKRLDTSTLDECNGKYMDPNNKRDYRYFLTTTYPYTIGCFRGKVANITTLSTCSGNSGNQGQVCACVDLGAPGLSVGHLWLQKEDVTMGRCGRQPYVTQRELTLVCDAARELATDFRPEDRQNFTCEDVKSLQSMLVIYGLKGGVAEWTGLGGGLKAEDFLGDIDSLMDGNTIDKRLGWIKMLLVSLGIMAELEVDVTIDGSDSWSDNGDWGSDGQSLDPASKSDLQDAFAQLWIIMTLGDQINNFTDPEVASWLFSIQSIIDTIKSLDATPSGSDGGQNSNWMVAEKKPPKPQRPWWNNPETQGSWGDFGFGPKRGSKDASMHDMWKHIAMGGKQSGRGGDMGRGWGKGGGPRGWGKSDGPRGWGKSGGPRGRGQRGGPRGWGQSGGPRGWGQRGGSRGWGQSGGSRGWGNSGGPRGWGKSGGPRGWGQSGGRDGGKAWGGPGGPSQWWQAGQRSSQWQGSQSPKPSWSWGPDARRGQNSRAPWSMGPSRPYGPPSRWGGSMPGGDGFWGTPGQSNTDWGMPDDLDIWNDGESNEFNPFSEDDWSTLFGLLFLDDLFKSAQDSGPWMDAPPSAWQAGGYGYQGGPMGMAPTRMNGRQMVPGRPGPSPPGYGKTAPNIWDVLNTWGNLGNGPDWNRPQIDPPGPTRPGERPDGRPGGRPGGGSGGWGRTGPQAPRPSRWPGKR